MGGYEIRPRSAGAGVRHTLSRSRRIRRGNEVREAIQDEGKRERKEEKSMGPRDIFIEGLEWL